MFTQRLLTTRPLLSTALVLLAALLATVFWSQSVTAQDAPAPPTDLSVVSDDGRLDVSWTAPAGTVTGYEVQYKFSRAFDQKTFNFRNGWEPRAHAGTATTHAITGLTNGNYKAGTLRYDVRVRAVNNSSKSGWVRGAGAPGVVATRLMLMGYSERELRDGNFRGRLRGQVGRATHVFNEYVYESQGTFPVTAQLNGPAPASGYTITLKAYGSGADALTMPAPFTIPEGQDRAVAHVAIADDEVSELTKWFILATASVSPSIPVRTVDDTSDAIQYGVVDNDQANWRPPFELDRLMVNGVKVTNIRYDGHNRAVLYTAQVPSSATSITIEPHFATTCPGCYYWAGDAPGKAFENHMRGTGQRIFWDNSDPRRIWILVSNGRGQHHYAHVTVHKMRGGDPDIPESAAYVVDPDKLKTGPNRDPRILSPLPDTVMTNQYGVKQVDLWTVFEDPDYDALSITAESSDEDVASVSVLPDYSTMTISAEARGTATITVTVADIRGGTVSDIFDVKVKAAPRAAAALADIETKAGADRNVALSGAFRDADGDPLTITATSSNETVATAVVAADGSRLTVRGVDEGSATIHVVALDADRNAALSTFEVQVDPGDGSPTPTPVPETESAVSRYDANDDGIIDKHEYARALLDYENRIINFNDLSEVKAAFLAPRVDKPLPDVTIVNESGTQEAALADVFWDFWGRLTLAAASGDESIVTARVSPDQSQLTVSAQDRGRATVVVTASDGNVVVSDTFVVVVKANPVVVAAIADVNVLPKGNSQDIPLNGVFRDPDGDAVNVSAASLDEAVATVSVKTDGSALTVTGVGAGAATVTVAAQDSDGNQVHDKFAINVPAPQPPIPPANQSPTVSSALSDVTIVSESGTRTVSLSGVFSDADNDDLTVTAASSVETVATVSVAAGYSNLAVSAHSRGTAAITVTAADGRGGTVSETFTVRVKAAPVVASSVSDISGLEAGDTQEVSLSSVFSDADGDSMTIGAGSSNNAIATVTVAADQSSLTLAAVSEGTTIITVTARDVDGNTASDKFSVGVITPTPARTPNQAPTVSTPIADATIVNENGTHNVTLSGVFNDADNDSLTVTATSSNTAVAAVLVAADQSSLTVAAKSGGTTTITVTANDGRGGTVEDAFTVKVKVAPAVASPLPDLSLEEGGSKNVSLSGVFNDADGDALTLTAVSSGDGIVSVFEFHGELTIVAVSDGTTTITVTAQDPDGNQVSDEFDVSVVGPPSVVANLRCIAETERVAFLWDVPEWSGGETYAYDYELTLPDGRSEGGRLIAITLLLRPGSYQAGAEAKVNVKVVYELPDGSNVSSAEETLTCRVK